MQIIHLSNLNGRALCGAVGKISMSGVMFNCPACAAANRSLTREQALKQIEAVAAQHRARQS